MVYDIITVGSALVDAFLHSETDEKNNHLCFPLGTKIRVNDIIFSVGGGASNSATSFSKLGLKTGLLGKTGQGYNAKIILRETKKSGVDFLGLQGKGHTGYSIILEGNKRHRTILTYKGESDNLKFSELSLSKLKTKWFYFTTMGSESFRTQKKLALFAKKKGIKIAYNPSSYHTKLGINFLKPILKYTTILTLNKEEAKMLTSSKNPHKVLSKLGPKIVCITDGENEGMVYDSVNLYKYYPPRIKSKECTGAGDAFGSSFVAGIIMFNDTKKAIKLAMVNSESVIKKSGAQAGLLTLKQALKKIKSNKFKIITKKI
jgi:ribokinase